MDTNLGRVVGYDGKQIELSRDSLYIKWRYVGDAVWKNLIALNDLKVGFPKGGKTDQVLTKLSNDDWDYVWKTPESSGGSVDTVQLASVTTAPEAPFPINTRYYNSNNNTIYRATEENTWENADTEEPVLGAFYIYDDEIYFYDQKFQSLYMVKTIPSTIFYANKIMEAGESSINMEVDLSNSLILSVHVNGHFQTYGKNYTISTENEESTIYFDESVDEDSEVDVVYSSYMELSGGGGVSDYNQLLNKPKINGTEIKGNKSADDLGLQNELISGTNIKTINSENILGSGNIAITTYQKFNNSWPTNTTFTAFISAIDNDNTAVEGMAYLGELTCSGLPTGISNAEAIVEIITSAVGFSKCIHVILTSGNVSPYRWEYTYWNGSSPKGWVGFQPELPSQSGKSGKYLTTNGSTISWGDAVDVQARQDIANLIPSQSGNNGKYLTTDGTSLSWEEVDLSSKQDKLTEGNGIIIDENNVISSSTTEWGTITGNINDQTDLVNTLNTKQNTLIAGEGIDITDNVISTTTASAGSSINFIYENVEVSNWIIDADNTYVDYTYKSNIYCPDVTSNMFAIVTFSHEDSTSGNYANVCETSEKAVTIWSKSNSVITIPTIVAFGPANVLTFIVKTTSDTPLNAASISVGTYTAVTDENGVGRISNIANGTYTYTIEADLYETKTGSVTIFNNRLTEQVTLMLIPIDAYAVESVTTGDTVKLNVGTGNSNTKYDVYAENTSIVNDLTLTDIAASTTTTGNIAQVELANPNTVNVTVKALDTNNTPIDADIEFNNSEEIDEVNINVIAKDLYLAFVKGTDIMYFKNDTRPFAASENTFESKSYTYYTYESNVMVSHSATTSSVTGGGANRYDGITLNIDTSDSFSNGIWTRDNNEDLEIDNGDATITTSSYLTDVNPIIPRTDNFIFSCAKLNPTQWDTKLIIGGQEKQFIDNQEFYIKANQLIEIYATKHNSDKMIDTYNKYFYISNDKHYKKVNFIISSSETNTTFKFIINGVEFIYIGSTANIDCYEGETINWELSKTGFVTQTGSYTVPSYPTIKIYDEGTKTLVAE